MGKVPLPQPAKASIAVLPFDNMSNDPEQAYFGDGISEDLITDLSKNPELLVVSRYSSFSFKGKPVRVEKIAEELGVRYVLEGSVRKAENRIRINAQLIDCKTGHHLWAERYDGEMGDVFALQDKITQKITSSLAVRITDEEQDRYAPKGTKNVEAYEAFLRSADIANYLRMDTEGMARAIPWFEKAIELDPNYSEAYAGLAEAYLRGSFLGIHRKLGISYRLARMRAGEYLRMAMRNPTHLAYREMSRWHLARWEHDKALENAEKSIALNPSDPDNNSIMAQALIFSGRPEQAAAYAERMRRTDPGCLS
jgi:TolB-like protein